MGSTSTTFCFVIVHLRGAWKQVLHTQLSLPSLLPLGSLGMDLEDKYKCEMNIGNTQLLIDGLEDFSNHFCWLSGTCKDYAVDNGIQKSKSCTLPAHCCIYNSLNSSGFIVFILGGKCLLQSLELCNDSLV